MIKVDVVRAEPAPPPIKEVVIKLCPRDADFVLRDLQNGVTNSYCILEIRRLLAIALKP